MGLLHRKSRWERMIEPVAGGGASRGFVKSGLAAVGTFVGVTLASAVVSSIRRPRDDDA
jgi:hypothetical protein